MGVDTKGVWADIPIGATIQRMRFLFPGTFVLGSPKNEEGREIEEEQRKTTLTKGFWMADSEATQKMWIGVIGNNPSRFTTDENLPVHGVSWIDCSEFIKKIRLIHVGVQFQLPTEIQWEYSCRAGSTGAYAGSLEDMAWYKNNSNRLPHVVKTKQPNAWGLYDMHGNIKEWCLDSDAGNRIKDNADQVDPIVDDVKHPFRVLRGGSFLTSSFYCRSATRCPELPKHNFFFHGFRFCINIDAP
jgi:formylglycine-generating enzyme required for sulfatase activity